MSKVLERAEDQAWHTMEILFSTLKSAFGRQPKTVVVVVYAALLLALCARALFAEPTSAYPDLRSVTSFLAGVVAGLQTLMIFNGPLSRLNSGGRIPES